MYIRSHEDNMCYLVWKNAIMGPGCQDHWIKSNGDSGGGVRYRGTSSEYGNQKHFGTMMREKRVKNAGNWTGC